MTITTVATVAALLLVTTCGVVHMEQSAHAM
jgi:hypothetical protein